MLAVVLTSDSAYSATGTPGGFEQPKADQLKRLDSRIKQLEDEKTCIARANREVSKMYRERARAAKKSGAL